MLFSEAPNAFFFPLFWLLFLFLFCTNLIMLLLCGYQDLMMWFNLARS